MNRVMNRNTNIVNNHEVARAMAAASQAKVKRKNKPTGSAPTPARPKKTTSVPTARKGARAPIATTPRQDLQTKFYEANGLRIPLYDQDGTGNKRKQHTRLAKSLLHKNLEQLLDIVEQYAGTAKRRELKDKGLSKVKVATWIEEKETLALGRHPKSALPSKCYSQRSYRANWNLPDSCRYKHRTQCSPDEQHCRYFIRPCSSNSEQQNTKTLQGVAFVFHRSKCITCGCRQQRRTWPAW
jgi:hypothetical protein